MPFKRKIRRIFCALAALATLASCGKLSDKAPAEHTLLPGGNVGCYDKLGDRVKRFFNGNIDEAEWLDTFDCVKDQIDFFRKYVRGSAVNGGYAQEDIAVLIRKFLIVNRPVSDAFVRSLFEIKASTFGGSQKVITFADLDEFIRLNEVLRKESLALLPRLQARRVSPSGQNLLALSDAIEKFGDHLAAYVGSLKGSIDVEKGSFIPFAREILTLNGGDGSLVDRYGDFVRNLKVVISGGKSEMIEKGAWPSLIREGAAFGGLLLAYRDMETESFGAPEDQDRFMIDLVRRAQVAMNRVILRHGSGIHLAVFDPVIDTLPWDGLNPEKRAAIKKDLRQIIYRGLQGRSENRLNTRAIENAVNLYERGMRSQIHLKRIYRDLSANPGRKDFEIAARRYLSGFDRSETVDEINLLIDVSKNFIGLFPEDSPRMVFTNAMRETRTKNHMIRMAWFRHVIDYLFSVYASGPETSPGHKAAKVEDLAMLSDDFVDILRSWKLADPSLTTMQMSAKRFREANLFTPVSNGDALVDGNEATYYVAFLMSSSSLSGRIYTTIVEDWRACPLIGYDELGNEAMAPACFRKFYFEHPEVFWKDFPGLLVAYTKMSDAERKQLAYAMEQVSRKGGYSEKPIGAFDIDSFAALPHYVEDIMERFDADDDEKLNRDEIFNRAFPIFKKTLSAYSSSEGIQKAILSYIIHYGEAPSSSAAVLLWWARMPFVKIEATRVDLYQVVVALAAPPKPMDSVEPATGADRWAFDGLRLH